MAAAKKRSLVLAQHWQGSYLSAALLIWLAIAFYRHNPYYSSFLSAQTQKSLLYGAFIYTILAPLVYLLIPGLSGSPNKPYLFLHMIARQARTLTIYLRKFPTQPSFASPKISKPEKIASLFLLVKFFFIPIMINFLYANFTAVDSGLSGVFQTENLLSLDEFNKLIFPLLFSSLLFIDTAYFVFGYLVESKKLNSQVRSVDATFFGWLVALMSYPPFNSTVGLYVVWYANDYVEFWTPWLTAVAHVVALVLMGIYTSASVALGAKCSNLTNRGIVGRGPYAVVRHPAYISKNLAWWVTIIPVASIAAVLGMAFWSLIYFLRAITEERHLIRDPDYQAYCIKVKYRFIPRVF